MAFFALITGDEVDNVVEVNDLIIDTYDEETGEPAGSIVEAVAADHAQLLFGADCDEVVEVADAIGPGWRRPAAGQPFAPPPRAPLIEVDGELVGDGADTILVAYVHEEPDPPASVVFTINGAQTPAVPVADGRAELELSAAAPGKVRIAVEGLTLTIEAR